MLTTSQNRFDNDAGDTCPQNRKLTSCFSLNAFDSICTLGSTFSDSNQILSHSNDATFGPVTNHYPLRVRRRLPPEVKAVRSVELHATQSQPAPICGRVVLSQSSFSSRSQYGNRRGAGSEKLIPPGILPTRHLKDEIHERIDSIK